MIEVIAGIEKRMVNTLHQSIKLALFQLNTQPISDSVDKRKITDATDNVVNGQIVEPRIPQRMRIRLGDIPGRFRQFDGKFDQRLVGGRKIGQLRITGQGDHQLVNPFAGP